MEEPERTYWDFISEKEPTAVERVVHKAKETATATKKVSQGALDGIVGHIKGNPKVYIWGTIILAAALFLHSCAVEAKAREAAMEAEEKKAEEELKAKRLKMRSEFGARAKRNWASWERGLAQGSPACFHGDNLLTWIEGQKPIYKITCTYRVNSDFETVVCDQSRCYEAVEGAPKGPAPGKSQ